MKHILIALLMSMYLFAGTDSLPLTDLTTKVPVEVRAFHKENSVSIDGVSIGVDRFTIFLEEGRYRFEEFSQEDSTRVQVKDVTITLSDSSGSRKVYLGDRKRRYSFLGVGGSLKFNFKKPENETYGEAIPLTLRPSFLYKLRRNRTGWFGIQFDWISSDYYDGNFACFVEFSRTVLSRYPFNLAVGGVVGFRYEQRIDEEYNNRYIDKSRIYQYRLEKYEWGGAMVEMPIVSDTYGLAIFLRATATIGVYYSFEDGSVLKNETSSSGFSVTPAISIYGTFRLGKR